MNVRRMLLHLALLSATSTCGVASSPSVQRKSSGEITSATTPHGSLPAALSGDGQIRSKPDGTARTIALPTGNPVAVVPLLITGRKPGIVAECAIRIAGREVITIGGVDTATEALLCYGLREAGALPSANGLRRIALVYATGSPNVVYRTPVVLVEAAGNGWAVDESIFDRFDGNDPRLTVATMKRKLARGR